MEPRNDGRKDPQGHTKGRGAAGGIRLSRRALLRTAGTAGLAAAAVGAAPGLVQWSGAAPAQLKGTSLSILQGTYFIGAAQDLYKKQAQEWGQTNGVTVATDFLELAGTSSRRSQPPSKPAATTSWNCGRRGTTCTLIASWT